MKKLVLFIVCILAFSSVWTQTNRFARKPIFEKKWYVGGQFNIQFSTVNDPSTDVSYLFKPSLGGGLQFQYYPLNFLGIGVSAGYFQRGAIIYTPDYDKSLGNPDSSYRMRLRFNSIDMQIGLIFRLPKELIKGTRFHVATFFNPHYNFQTNTVFHSVEDGFHDIQDRSADFYTWDMGMLVRLGADINVNNLCVFQVGVVYNPGFSNVYKNNVVFPNRKGTNQVIGIHLGFVY